uniref:Uncharacterized protein n=1 Tax=Ditylenchus dipsaci TaxID=166011 RepID=A0A915CQL4_9BILA
MADLNMALSPFDCFKRPQPSTPRNTSVIVRDYLHEDSLLWSVPRKEVVKLRFAHIQNPLNSKWALWYITEEDKVRSWYDRLQLAVCIKILSSSGRRLYAFVLRPYELPTTSAYCLFKDGIRPVWTDKSNINGGQWAISILKSQDEFLNGKSDHIKKLSKYWKTFLIALAGDQLEGYTEFICGAVITIDHDKDEVALWISDVSNDKSTGIGNILKQLLKLANDENLKFEKHPLTISPVLTVYGLSQLNFNCERVFNLMCLYGDCLKVLFSRDGTCMIQMRNGEQAQNVIDHLSACKVFGKEISFVSMRKTEIRQPIKECIFKMPGGFSSFADYSDSPHLRFSYQEICGKFYYKSRLIH